MEPKLEGINPQSEMEAALDEIMEFVGEHVKKIAAPRPILREDLTREDVEMWKRFKNRETNPISQKEFETTYGASVRNSRSVSRMEFAALLRNNLASLWMEAYLEKPTTEEMSEVSYVPEGKPREFYINEARDIIYCINNPLPGDTLIIEEYKKAGMKLLMRPELSDQLKEELKQAIETPR